MVDAAMIVLSIGLAFRGWCLGDSENYAPAGFGNITRSLLQNPSFRESKRNRMEHEHKSEREPRSILQEAPMCVFLAMLGGDVLVNPVAVAEGSDMKGIEQWTR